MSRVVGRCEENNEVLQATVEILRELATDLEAGKVSLLEVHKSMTFFEVEDHTKDGIDYIRAVPDPASTLLLLRYTSDVEKMALSPQETVVYTLADDSPKS